MRVHALTVLLLCLAPLFRIQAGDADFKPYTEKIPNSTVTFDMVPVPGGTFKMGSPDGEAKRNPDEGPQHEVTLKPFWIGKTEVTWEEFEIYAYKHDLKEKEEKGIDPKKQPETEIQADAVTRPTPPYTDMTFGLGHDKQPAICMTHHSAMEYCRWLSAKTGKTYRLPTEAEWEYACRAGSTTAYSFGDDPKALKDYGWFGENSDGKPQQVAQKKPNAWGIYDMHGNAAEWCFDHYDDKFYATLKSPAAQPVNMPTKLQYRHVARGGAWDDEAPALRSAARRGSTKDWKQQDPQLPQSIWWLTDAKFVGFRVVRPVEEQEGIKGFKSLIIKGEGD